MALLPSVEAQLAKLNTLHDELDMMIMKIDNDFEKEIVQESSQRFQVGVSTPDKAIDLEQLSQEIQRLGDETQKTFAEHADRIKSLEQLKKIMMVVDARINNLQRQKEIMESRLEQAFAFDSDDLEDRTLTVRERIGHQESLAPLLIDAETAPREVADWANSDVEKGGNTIDTMLLDTRTITNNKGEDVKMPGILDKMENAAESQGEARDAFEQVLGEYKDKIKSAMQALENIWESIPASKEYERSGSKVGEFMLKHLDETAIGPGWQFAKEGMDVNYSYPQLRLRLYRKMLKDAIPFIKLGKARDRADQINNIIEIFDEAIECGEKLKTSMESIKEKWKNMRGWTESKKDMHDNYRFFKYGGIVGELAGLQRAAEHEDKWRGTNLEMARHELGDDAWKGLEGTLPPPDALQQYAMNSFYGGVIARCAAAMEMDPKELGSKTWNETLELSRKKNCRKAERLILLVNDIGASKNPPQPILTPPSETQAEEGADA